MGAAGLVGAAPLLGCWVLRPHGCRRAAAPLLAAGLVGAAPSHEEGALHHGLAWPGPGRASPIAAALLPMERGRECVCRTRFPEGAASAWCTTLCQLDSRMHASPR